MTFVSPFFPYFFFFFSFSSSWAPQGCCLQRTSSGWSWFGYFCQALWGFLSSTSDAMPAVHNKVILIGFSTIVCLHNCTVVQLSSIIYCKFQSNLNPDHFLIHAWPVTSSPAVLTLGCHPKIQSLSQSRTDVKTLLCDVNTDATKRCYFYVFPGLLTR